MAKMNRSRTFYTHIGLPQGSSLSPYLFIVYHSDLVLCLGAHSSHIFADDLSVLISPPIVREFKPMVKFLAGEATEMCNEIAKYLKRWKRPPNLTKTVIQIFYSQVKRPVINICTEDHKLEVVKEFKYLGFTWSN